ncbi:MAG: phosphoribosylformimino-5-aminoimidazole carboxamide ribotide isomerase [Lentisphaerae bacterium]|jgi:phosphoribosylformimino-5-aminoimidazole carboxamide ribotide isomerase|nr:phosphoribosylformimino-5-aminoimidazole carboxamide ribotide isomerase [Lentisphaerota bacterium]
MRFRPCIDLHNGCVKQIVGSTLAENPDALQTNFIASQPPSYYAQMYRRDGLTGGHVIMLGKGNEDAAREALAAYPGGMQIGGGITPENALEWLDAGAAKVIVTSYLFPEQEFCLERLQRLSALVTPEHLVLDLSCRRQEGRFVVACNRWQTLTSLVLDLKHFELLGEYCSEFLIHAVDVEGKQSGIDSELLQCLAENCPLPVTYAGGVSSIEDVEKIAEAGQNRIDFTVGSALDIFGGSRLKYADLLHYKE